MALKRSVKVIGERPAVVVDNDQKSHTVPGFAQIWNATRPLIGHITWTDPQGRFGWFFAAIIDDPDVDYVTGLSAREAIDFNTWMDGREITYVSREEAQREQMIFYIQSLSEKLATKGLEQERQEACRYAIQIWNRRIQALNDPSTLDDLSDEMRKSFTIDQEAGNELVLKYLDRHNWDEE